MDKTDIRNASNGELLKERERMQTRLNGLTRAARVDKSIRPAVEEVRVLAQAVEDEIARRGIDDFLKNIPLL